METSPRELLRQFGPLADLLQTLTEPLSPDEGSPALRLAALTGKTARLVAFVLHNFDEGQMDSARHNLPILLDLAERLVTTTRAAMVECDARTSTLDGRCLAKVQLADAEREWLESRPNAANQVPASLTCDLEAKHSGSHAANAQMSDVEWWVHWTLFASEITSHVGCGAEMSSRDPDNLDKVNVCLLYANHPGKHSFAIGE
jgi:hypothetical protein